MLRRGGITDICRRAWELGLPQTGGAVFLVTLACLDISSKKRCLYRLFTYHLKAHTISNKLVSKVFAQKNGGGGGGGGKL